MPSLKVRGSAQFVYSVDCKQKSKYTISATTRLTLGPNAGEVDMASDDYAQEIVAGMIQQDQEHPLNSIRSSLQHAACRSLPATCCLAFAAPLVVAVSIAFACFC